MSNLDIGVFIKYVLNLMLVSHCAEVNPRWTHEYVSLAAPSGILWHAKDFAMSPEVDAEVGETQLGIR